MFELNMEALYIIADVLRGNKRLLAVLLQMSLSPRFCSAGNKPLSESDLALPFCSVLSLPWGRKPVQHTKKTKEHSEVNVYKILKFRCLSHYSIYIIK